MSTKRAIAIAGGMFVLASAAAAQGTASAGLSPGLAGRDPDVGRTAVQAHAPDANVVVRWNAYAGGAALAACIAPGDDPLHESRMYAIMHIAIHDALNSIDRRYRAYAYHGDAPGASPAAAVDAAAHDTLVASLSAIPAPFPQSCIDAAVSGVEDDYTAELATIPAGASKTAGVKVGQAAAAAVLDLRVGDGSDTPLIVDDYPQGTEPGEYRFTPGTPFAFAPGWAGVTPFALRDAAQFRPGPPYSVGSKAYARDLAEVKRLGGDDVTTPSDRTPEQTQIALFWLESSPLAWNRIGRTLAETQGLNRWESARLFGLLDMAMADGYVASFDTKWNAYNYWRPVTAIQLADEDGNPWTHADPTWTPLRPTPPIPDYDSAHAVEGAAAAAVFRNFFGTDHMAFSQCSRTLPSGTCTDVSPTLRSFSRFSQAAHENGISRILIGFHFRKAVTAGLDHGRKIGHLAFARYMQPVD
jgi:hypothetical protein